MESKKTYIVGNWKMHGDAAMAATLVDVIAAQAAKGPANVEVILCPPATLIGEVARRMIGSRLHVGGQDCHIQPEGAFTGDISAKMLADAGASYVIVGHSERRSWHNENNITVRKKALAAIKARLTPIICIGETQAERDSGKAKAVIEQQLWESIPEEAAGVNFLLAYEPVWAIGSGQTATAVDITDMHAHIASIVAKKIGNKTSIVPVLYGGSVKATNASEILTSAGVSGVLVGGASLKAEEFCKIIGAAI